MSVKSPETYAAEVKAEGMNSPAFSEAVQALQSEADRQAFIRGILNIDDADGTPTVQSSDVIRLQDRLKDATEKSAFAGQEQPQGTATQTQLAAFNARYQTWTDGLEPWTQAVDSVLQNVTVGGKSGHEWAPPQPESEGVGSAD